MSTIGGAYLIYLYLKSVEGYLCKTRQMTTSYTLFTVIYLHIYCYCTISITFVYAITNISFVPFSDMNPPSLSMHLRLVIC